MVPLIEVRRNVHEVLAELQKVGIDIIDHMVRIAELRPLDRSFHSHIHARLMYVTHQLLNSVAIPLDEHTLWQKESPTLPTPPASPPILTPATPSVKPPTGAPFDEPLPPLRAEGTDQLHCHRMDYLGPRVLFDEPLSPQDPNNTQRR